MRSRIADAEDACFRIWSRWLLGCVLVLLVFQPLEAQQVVDSAAGEKYRIAALDILAIGGLGDESSVVYHVDCDGMIKVPWLGKVPAAGLTPNQLAAELNLRYQEHLYNPQVKVQLKESKEERPVRITGAVQHPGYLPTRGRQSLGAALVRAGGFTASAFGTVQIRRYQCSAECDLSSQTGLDRCWRTTVYQFHDVRNDATIYVDPGDVVDVTESESVLVIGQVYAPQFVFSRSGLTVTRAIAMVGGVLPNAHVDKAHVFRRTEQGCFATIEIDLKLIGKKKAEDFPILGGDILEVTNKYMATRTPLICVDNNDSSELVR